MKGRRNTTPPGGDVPSPRTAPRRWHRADVAGSGDYGIEFTIMSYNILSDDLLFQNAYLYVGCDSSVLKWQYRFERLVNEVSQHAPAILCIQEVDKLHKGSFFSVMGQLGYHGFFCGRTGSKPDGCALFWCARATQNRPPRLTSH